jgi:UrcA family protein
MPSSGLPLRDGSMLLPNDLPNSRETIMKITIAIFAALALGGSAMSIAADNDVPQAVVKFGDLDLSSLQGAARLYSRIDEAARKVCKPFDVNVRDIGSRTRLDACVHKAIADAVTTVAQPQLLAIYNAKNHQSRPIIVATAQSR